MIFYAAVKLLVLNLLKHNDAELYGRVPLIQDIWQNGVIFKTSISANLCYFKGMYCKFYPGSGFISGSLFDLIYANDEICSLQTRSGSLWNLSVSTIPSVTFKVFCSTLNVFTKQIISLQATTKSEITPVPIFSPLQSIKDEEKVYSLSFCIFCRTSVTRKTTLIKRIKDGLWVPDPEKMLTATHKFQIVVTLL